MLKRVITPLAFLMLRAAVSTAAGAPRADPAPDLSDARVTVPYQELKALWAAAQKQPEAAKEESKPPVETSVVAARYQMALDGDRAVGTAVFEIQEFTDKWSVVPLIGTDAQLGGIEPTDAQVIIRDGYYQLVSNKPGKQTVTVHFSAPVAATREGSQFLLPVTPASINTLTVTSIPQKQALRVANGTRVGDEKTGYSYLLGPKDRLDVSLVPERMTEAPIASHWKIEPQAYVQFKDGKLAYEAHVTAHAEDGSGMSMELTIPADANVSDITGGDMASWRVTAGEGESQVAHIIWQTRDVLRREVDVTYDLPQPLTAEQWQLAAPELAGGESSPPLYVLAQPAGLDLAAKDVSQVPRQLPDWLLAKAAGTNYLAIVGNGPIKAKWLPLMQTPRAVAESVQASMRIVSDGALVNEMEYNIQHEAAYAWRLTMPEGAEILASSVDGRAVNPIDRGGHVIEFALPAGRSGDQVRISYTAKRPAFQPVSGNLSIDLPATELLTNKLAWSLNIPAAYEVAACEGNVEPDPGGTAQDADSRVIHLHREIFKGDRPAVELFYQKPGAIQ